MTHAMRFRTRITNRKKTKRHVIFLHPKEERERESNTVSYYLQTLYLGSNRGYLILNNGDSCLKAY
jgi:hypothetical protein